MRVPTGLARRLAGLGLACAAAACGGSGPEAPPAAAPLRVGLEAAYPPFESVDASGAFVGFDVDLARGLAEALGRPAEFRNLSFDALIPDLQAGRLDVVCSAMSWLPERAQAVDFSRPYLQVRMGVLASRERAASVRALSDLDAPGTVVAVHRGTSGEVKARESFPRAEVRPYDSEVDAASEVAAGRAHAFVYDMVSVRKLAAKEPDRVRVLDGDLGREVYCMAFPKGSPLVGPADRFLDAASAPGGLIDRLMERWGPDAERVASETK
jgi:polar amino acid transport system substrate-binding protein